MAEGVPEAFLCAVCGETKPADKMKPRYVKGKGRVGYRKICKRCFRKRYNTDGDRRRNAAYLERKRGHRYAVYMACQELASRYPTEFEALVAVFIEKGRESELLGFQEVSKHLRAVYGEREIAS